MLSGQHSGLEQLSGVTGLDRHVSLANDGSTVYDLGDEMDSTAGFGLSGSQCLPDRIDAGELGQEARMCVQQLPVISLCEPAGQNTHETGQNNQIGLVAVDDLGQYPIERLSIGKSLVLDNLDRNGAFAGVLEARRLRFIGNDGDDFATAQTGRLLSPQNRCEIRPAARDQYDNPSSF